MGDSITLENFGPRNRTKNIGNSQYRICRVNDDWGIWYIHETYNDGSEWSSAKGYGSYDLAEVIDTFNAISKEKEITGTL